MFVKAEPYLELSRASMMQFFRKIVDGFQLLLHKASSEMLDWVLNMHLNMQLLQSAAFLVCFCFDGA